MENTENKESSDKIVQSIVTQFISRSNVGIKKYGTTLEQSSLGTLEWIEHAKQEAMDFILYLEKLKTVIEEKQKDNTLLT